MHNINKRDMAGGVKGCSLTEENENGVLVLSFGQEEVIRTMVGYKRQGTTSGMDYYFKFRDRKH